MDDMRVRFAAFVKEEESLRNLRSQTAQTGARVAVLSGVSLSLLLGVVLAFLSRRQLIAMSRSYERAIALTQQQTEALREREQRFRAILETTRDWIWSTDESRLMTYTNPAVETILGYTAKELLGNDVLLHMHEDDLARVEASLPDYIQTKQGWTNLVARWRHKDGSYRYLESSGVAILDDDGHFAGFRGTNRDITEREHAEEALRESEQSYRFLSEGIPHQVWTAQPDGKLDYVNQRTVNYFGRTQEQILGEGWQDVVHPKDLPGCIERWGWSLQTGEPYEVSFRLRNADGPYRWHRGRATAGHDSDGTITKWFGTNSDIEDQTAAEVALSASEEQLRQSQKMEAVGQLAGGVAHDFNNLLTAINGYSALALQRLEGPHPIKSYLEEVKKAGERAANLTRQLLAFGRKQILQPLALDLNGVVSDMNKMLRRLIGEDIVFATKLDTDLGKVMADPGQIEQVLVNLIVNARDAMPQGGNLTVETKNVELDEEYGSKHVGVTPGKYVLLAVSDTGEGMSEEVRQRVFEPFFTTKEKGKGTGLGLSTVYGIVNQSGGNIWIYSEPGRGTTFKVYLPEVECERREPAERVAEVAPRGGSETVLVVEDEEVVRGLARRILEQAGYLVVEASRADQALRFCSARAADVDLLLTDVVMPEMSGKELADKLKSQYPKLKILFMSGYTDEAIVHHGVLDPSVEFLQKPFTPATLVRKVRDVLDLNGNSVNGEQHSRV
jgi:PAS domain S-box-containing protein